MRVLRKLEYRKLLQNIMMRIVRKILNNVWNL